MVDKTAEKDRDQVLIDETPPALFSLLNYWLVIERHPPRLGKHGRLDTPFVLSIATDPLPIEVADHYIVTAPRNKMACVQNRLKPEILTAMHACMVADEHHLMKNIMDFYVTQIVEREWGNYAVIKNNIGVTHLDDALDFLKEYTLDCVSIFMGEDALKACDAFLSNKKAPDNPLIAQPIAFYQHRPVFLLPDQPRRIVFNTSPDCTGLVTRVGDYVSVYMHNPARSCVVYDL
jgi:hypothetical protein